MGLKDCRLLHKFLNSQKLMSLATTSGFSLWSTPLKFWNDKFLNIYFISGGYTKHANNITNNHRVSLSVFDSKQAPNEKLSFQASGFCEKLNGLTSEKILDKWNKKFESRTVTLEDLKRIDSSIFKIVLTKAKYTNTNLYEKVLEIDL
ncbi:pyridoxamine 5'-phosphate oxidase family protein [Patescibacteria group bacterium]